MFHIYKNYSPFRLSFTGINKLSITKAMSSGLKYLSQEEAISLDEELFTTHRFSVDQLMELAGLSVATAMHRAYFETHATKPVLAIAGPGNNGGDAMVAVRHMKLFGFQNITLLVTRKPQKDLFINLIQQASESGVTVSYDPHPYLSDDVSSLVLDGLFGFSFKPPVRSDYVPFMNILMKSFPVASIDIPSGWDVESGPPTDQSFMPDTLISLTAPKKSAALFKGQNHFLGGRFVPPSLAIKYKLNLPPYPSTDSILRLL